MCQRKCTLKLLQYTGYLACKPACTPMSFDVKLQKDDGHSGSDILAYHRLNEKLVYLTNTPIDICFAVNHLSKFLNQPM